MLVFGDSLSAGYGIAIQQSWPALLAKRLEDNRPPWSVSNASISGETTAGGRARFKEALDRVQPAVVVLALGANDGLRGLSPAQMRDNLLAMIRAAKDRKARVLLVGMKLPPNYGPDYVRQFEQAFARVAREALKADLQKSQGVNPTYLAFIARATVDTLGSYPWINAEIRGEKIVTRSFVNLGIAVALDEGRGLIVPVIRNAQDMNLLGIARSIADLAQRARTKKLLPDDVQGGTFTITNPGGFGTFHGTPIINQPQVGILGTYALVKRPWVVQDAFGKDVIAIRPLMNITLTYDHRLVDGAYSGGFMKELRERLEGWDEHAS